MDCARFENELVALLGEEQGERTARVDQLRHHTESCESCRGSRELVEMLLVDPESRDPVPDPGERYWASFRSRLRQRIRQEQARRRRRWIAAVASAAALVLFVLSISVWRPGRGPEPEAIVDIDAGGAVFSDNLDDRLREADAGAAMMATDLLVGSVEGNLEWGLEGEAAGLAGSEGWDGWLFPDTADLDEQARRELLDWLEEQEAQLQGGQA